MVFKSLEWKIDKLEAEYSNVKTLLVHFAQLENKLVRLLAVADDRVTPAAVAELRAIQEQLSPMQYADFEKRFRGDSEEISRRLASYLPLFAVGGEILDIGCGRGEFMALLRRGRPPATGAGPFRLHARRSARARSRLRQGRRPGIPRQNARTPRSTAFFPPRSSSTSSPATCAASLPSPSAS